jgi:hypothetical protein
MKHETYYIGKYNTVEDRYNVVYSNGNIVKNMIIKLI